MMAARSRGFALLLVLWTVALLTVIAGGFAFAMRGESSLTGNLVERNQAGALADGGVQIGIARLLEPEEADRWRVDGTVYQTMIAGHPVRISLQSELGKVDLNRAPDALIRALAHSALPAGADKDGTAAEAIADAILDWRDGNRNRRLRGAEDPDYAAAGRPYGSRDGPFISVEELSEVLGVTPALFARLAPLVTVYSGRPQVDPATAPRGVLLALPGLTREQVDTYLAARDSAAEKGQPVTTTLASSASGVLSAPSQPSKPVPGTFTVLAEARIGEALARRAVVVRARPSRAVRRVRTAARRVRLPYTVLAWTDQPREPALEMPAAGAEHASGERRARAVR